MPTTSEIIAALVGCWKIARQDPTALTGFEFSADAFWRSFAAIVFTIPFYLVFITAEWRMIGEAGVIVDNTLAGFAAIELLSYASYWVLYPLAMIFACRYFGLTGAFAPYITVYNWASVLVMVLLAPAYVLYSFGLATAETASFLILIAFVTALLYRWQIALTVFATTPSIAAAIVGVELVLGFAINLTASMFLGIGA